MPTPVIRARPGVVAQPVEGARDGVGEVAAGRTARVGQAAGHRESAWIVERESECVAGQSDRRRESRSTGRRRRRRRGRRPPTTARARPTTAMAAERDMSRALGDARRVLGVRPPVQVEAPVLARRRARRPSLRSPAAARPTCRRPSPRPRAWCTANRRNGCRRWRCRRSRRRARSGARHAGWPPRRRSSPPSSSRPRPRRRSSEAPRAARRAVSHSGNVSHACITSWASSDCVRRLPRKRGGLPVAPRQPLAALLRRAHRGQRLGAARSGRGPSRRAASPSAVRFTSSCGVVPPIPE